MATLDDTHFSWVHEGILGDRTISHDFIPKRESKRREFFAGFIALQLFPRCSGTVAIEKQKRTLATSAHDANDAQRTSKTIF
ncbi:MAG TPA: hypothetical protein VMF32_12115 [Xanthobacteraceae bacterium]|nr:hypothetical protein [Xanthobacteraceae bacterium]